LNKLELPQKAAYEIGKIVKVFKKPKVVVVSVAKSLAVGDVVFFQRTVQNFAAAGADASHIWTSKQTNVSEIRTDDHDLLDIAKFNPDYDVNHINNHVSIQVEEVGKAGDSLMWIGRHSS